MSKVLYVTSSSYSGSTLLTFLLNQHPQLCTIGELEGWDYGSEEYRCSCGELIDDCNFFGFIRKKYEQRGLSFSSRNFGTKLKLLDSPRVNRYVTSAIPYVKSTAVETLRDRLFWSMPWLKRRFDHAVECNSVFVNAALEYSGAKVFVDATKNPFRLRMLNKVPDFNIKVLYLVRDIQGVVASNIRKKNISVQAAAAQWVADQLNIIRILKEFPGFTTLYYEDLCNTPDDSLSMLYRYMGVAEYEFGGAIRQGEHHILGNSMRVTSTNDISLDRRSEQELSYEHVSVIEKTLKDQLQNCRDQEVKNLLSRYSRG